MSIRSAVTMYFDNLVEPMFQRDEEGRDLFFPMGLGSKGRIVPDAATNARLRSALRTGYMVFFLAILPAASVLSVWTPKGALPLVAFVGVVTVMQLAYTSWLARGLEVTRRRMNLSNQTASIATAYSARYIRWMTILSALLTAGGVIGFFMPAADWQPVWGRPMAAASALFFAAITVMWLRAGQAKARMSA